MHAEYTGPSYMKTYRWRACSLVCLEPVARQPHSRLPASMISFILFAAGRSQIKDHQVKTPLVRASLH